MARPLFSLTAFVTHRLRSACRALAVVALLNLGPSSVATAQAPVYRITDLGFDIAYSINDYGQVAGYSFDSERLATLWTPNSANGTEGSRIELGPVGQECCRIKVNDHGQVSIASFNDQHPSRLWTPSSPNTNLGAAVDLTELLNVKPESYLLTPQDLNNHGQFITGYYYSGEDEEAGDLLWRPDEPNGLIGSYLRIDDESRFTAVAINDHGFIAGFDNTALLWTPTLPDGDTGTITSLGTLPGDVSSSPVDMNVGGQIIGSSTSGEGVNRAFLWTPTTPGAATGTMIDLELGPLSEPASINASGYIVGTDYFGIRPTPFLYTPQGNLASLGSLIPPESGWDLFQATAINDAGQIVGEGIFDGRVTAFLMTPVPEPASLALLALMLPAAAARRGRPSTTT